MLQYGTLTTGEPKWLSKRTRQKSFVLGGLTYRERDTGTRQCLIVKDYADLTNLAGDYNELLCAANCSPLFIDLGDAPENHDLIINIESGTVYVNGHAFSNMAGLVSLGDGSWGVAFEGNPLRRVEGLVSWIIEVYKKWLVEVYEKVNHLGMIEIIPLHEKSIWHLIFDDLPKGRIIAKMSKIGA